ncbi:MAG: hypothetical protein N838_13495 [Thiohalocapsa sp. PB-PSB1]|nr:MAG: hypothetical protein N838_13495 [Thiohalocapsa sp. PB-PSB1]
MIDAFGTEFAAAAAGRQTRNTNKSLPTEDRPNKITTKS